MKKAVFLDRDGTIIEDVGYPHEISQIKFLPRVNEAIKLLNEKAFKVIVVTNQSGVARGYFTEETVKAINKYIQESLAKQGAFIDNFYYCPHHIEGVIAEYRKDCYCRKPNPGMIEEAVNEFSIDIESSFVIGDKMSDIEAGRRVSARTVLLAGEDNRDKEPKTVLTSDHVAPDLYQAVQWLLKLSGQKRGKRAGGGVS